MATWAEIQKQAAITKQLQDAGLLGVGDYNLGPSPDTAPLPIDPLVALQKQGPALKEQYGIQRQGLGADETSLDYTAPMQDTKNTRQEIVFGVPEDSKKLQQQILALEPGLELALDKQKKLQQAREAAALEAYKNLKERGTPPNWGLITSFADNLFGTKTNEMSKFVESPADYNKRLHEALSAYTAASAADPDITGLASKLKLYTDAGAVGKPVAMSRYGTDTMDKGAKLKASFGQKPSPLQTDKKQSEDIKFGQQFNKDAEPAQAQINFAKSLMNYQDLIKEASDKYGTVDRFSSDVRARLQTAYTDLISQYAKASAGGRNALQVHEMQFYKGAIPDQSTPQDVFLQSLFKGGSKGAIIGMDDLINNARTVAKKKLGLLETTYKGKNPELLKEHKDFLNEIRTYSERVNAPKQGGSGGSKLDADIEAMKKQQAEDRKLLEEIRRGR